MSTLSTGTPSFHHDFADGTGKVLQTRGNATSDRLPATQNCPSAGAILAWLEAHGTELVIQSIPAGRRRKNRAILQYRDVDGEVRAVGGATIAAAVWKAAVRQLSRRGITCTQAALGGQKE